MFLDILGEYLRYNLKIKHSLKIQSSFLLFKHKQSNKLFNLIFISERIISTHTML